MMRMLSPIFRYRFIDGFEGAELLFVWKQPIQKGQNYHARF